MPCCAVPEIVGSAVLDGGESGGAVTVAVGAEVADAEPPVLLAVTTTSMVDPTSELWSV
jgi:hypothetical protein